MKKTVVCVLTGAALASIDDWEYCMLCRGTEDLYRRI